MPRSSGGGSRGGGSRSSSSSRSGSSGNSRRRSTTYFPGSCRYMYYDRHNRVHFTYCNFDPTAKPSPFRFLLILFYIPFFAVLIPMLASSAFTPEKLDNPNSEIIIDDTIHVLDDEEALRDSLTHFYDVTGVAPAVLTVSDDEWRGHFDSLETYAYEVYCLNFPDDEMKWLIVYSEGEPFDELSNWSWEGMIGEDTLPSISYHLCDVFTENLQKKLYAFPPEEAIAMAFTELLDDRTFGVDWTTFGTAMGSLLFITVHFIIMFSAFSGNKKLRNAKPVNNEVKEILCNRCNGSYISSEKYCPHCGAPSPAAFSGDIQELVVEQSDLSKPEPVRVSSSERRNMFGEGFDE